MANPVQTKVGSWNGGASTAATSFTSLPASGGAVIAAIRIYTGGSAGTVSSVTDNQTGNTYTKIKQLTDTSTNGDIELWWCSSITAPSGTFTVTANLSGSFQARCDLIEGTSGLSLDQTGQNQATGTSGSVTASGANTSTTDFVIAAIEVSYDAGSSISGPSTGYTGFVSDTGFVTFVDTNIAYKTESSTVTSTATAWSWTNNQPYAAILATFKSSSGGNVTVALTGKSATFTAGTLTPNSSLALTGQQSIFTAGNLGGTDADALVGQKATFSTGLLTPNITVGLTGQAATFTAGTVIATPQLALTGQGATYSTGTLSVSIDTALNGSVGTFTPGQLGVQGDVTVSLIGQAATFSTGNLTASVPVIIADFSGGFYEEFERAYRVRKRKKLELEEKLKAEKDIQDDLDRQIAELLHKQEAIDEQRKHADYIASLTKKAVQHKQDFTEKTNAALEAAIEKKTVAALEIFERELAKQIEEEDLALLILLN